MRVNNEYNDRMSKTSSNKNEFSFAEGVLAKGKVNSIDMDQHKHSKYHLVQEHVSPPQLQRQAKSSLSCKGIQIANSAKGVLQTDRWMGSSSSMSKNQPNELYIKAPNVRLANKNSGKRSVPPLGKQAGHHRAIVQDSKTPQYV